MSYLLIDEALDELLDDAVTEGLMEVMALGRYIENDQSYEGVLTPNGVVPLTEVLTEIRLMFHLYIKEMLEDG